MKSANHVLLTICLNYELFSYIGLSDIDHYTPIGSTPPTIQGEGIVKMCFGCYVDHDGLKHPIDLEIETIYWVYRCAINHLETMLLVQQITFL